MWWQQNQIVKNCTVPLHKYHTTEMYTKEKKNTKHYHQCTPGKRIPLKRIDIRSPCSSKRFVCCSHSVPLARSFGRSFVRSNSVYAFVWKQSKNEKNKTNRMEYSEHSTGEAKIAHDDFVYVNVMYGLIRESVEACSLDWKKSPK